MTRRRKLPASYLCRSCLTGASHSCRSCLTGAHAHTHTHKLPASHSCRSCLAGTKNSRKYSSPVTLRRKYTSALTFENAERTAPGRKPRGVSKPKGEALVWCEFFFFELFMSLVTQSYVTTARGAARPRDETCAFNMHLMVLQTKP